VILSPACVLTGCQSPKARAPAESGASPATRNNCERRVRKSAAALLLSGRIGERFDAIVTVASDKGTWVRLFQPPTEGRLERGFQGLDVGDRVHVKLIHTDVKSGFIDFACD